VKRPYAGADMCCALRRASHLVGCKEESLKKGERTEDEIEVGGRRIERPTEWLEEVCFYRVGNRYGIYDTFRVGVDLRFDCTDHLDLTCTHCGAPFDVKTKKFPDDRYHIVHFLVKCTWRDCDQSHWRMWRKQVRDKNPEMVVVRDQEYPRTFVDERKKREKREE